MRTMDNIAGVRRIFYTSWIVYTEAGRDKLFIGVSGVLRNIYYYATVIQELKWEDA